MDSPRMDVNEAINFLHDRKEHDVVRRVEDLFCHRLKTPDIDLEQQCQCLFYLLCAKLKKHSVFETPDVVKVRHDFLEKIHLLEHQVVHNFSLSKKQLPIKHRLRHFIKQPNTIFQL